MLNPDLISNKFIGHTFISQLFYFDEIDSTNSFAKLKNLADGSLVITGFQKKGKGRFDRKWNSEKGKNLTFTIVKKFDFKYSEQVNLIFAVTYAIFKTLKKIIEPGSGISGKKVKIKWPNDIIINNKKAAGILIETNPKKNIFIIGIGINVNQLFFPAVIAKRATSLLNETGLDTDLNLLLIKLVKNLHNAFKLIEDKNFIKLFKQWKANVGFIGKEVVFIDTNSRKLRGYVKDVLTNGQIQIEKDGKIHNFNSGEIRLQI